MRRIYVSQEIYDLCNKFAEKSVDSSVDHYEKRNQSNKANIKEQISIGKVGEFGAYFYLQGMISNISKPDLKIYNSENKSFDYDLKSDKYNVHVKSQLMTTAYEFGLSWTFQYGNKNSGHFDSHIFNNDLNQHIILTLVHPTFVDVLSFCNVKVLHEYNLFKDPKVDKLKGIKKVIYYDDLIKIPTEKIFEIKDPV